LQGVRRSSEPAPVARSVPGPAPHHALAQPTPVPSPSSRGFSNHMTPHIPATVPAPAHQHKGTWPVGVAALATAHRMPSAGQPSGPPGSANVAVYPVPAVGHGASHNQKYPVNAAPAMAAYPVIGKQAPAAALCGHQATYPPGGGGCAPAAPRDLAYPAVARPLRAVPGFAPPQPVLYPSMSAGQAGMGTHANAYSDPRGPGVLCISCCLPECGTVR
jgi:hypothetical protein